MHRLDALIDWIRRTAGPARGLLVPVSGGSDSALCFWLCTRAFPDKTLGVHVGPTLRACPWFKALGTIEVVEPPAGPALDGEVGRWALFLELGLRSKSWLVGSRNRTEEVFGTYSMASRLAAYLPLAGLWKSEVMELCDRAGVPVEITQSSRRADPACGRPVELAEIPLEVIDLFLRVKEGELAEGSLAALTPAQCDYLERVHAGNQFKRALPTRPPVFPAKPPLPE
jgi:NH3-dependent NAD+ synthetase